MPRHTAKRSGLLREPPNADGAATVLRDRQRWADHLAMIFRAQYLRTDAGARVSGPGPLVAWQPAVDRHDLLVGSSRSVLKNLLSGEGERPQADPGIELLWFVRSVEAAGSTVHPPTSSSAHDNSAPVETP